MDMMTGARSTFFHGRGAVAQAAQHDRAAEHDRAA
jgi:hypothetical protein